MFSLSNDMKEKYFEKLLESMNSEDEDSAADFTIEDPGYNNSFENNVMINEIDSDAETQIYPVEIGHGGDSDLELSSEEETDGEENEGDDQEDGEQEENFYVGKDGTKWSKLPPGMHRIRKQNIFREGRFVGPSPGTKNLSEVDTFFSLMHPTIQSIICRNTNRKGKAAYQMIEDQTGSTSQCQQ